MNKSTFGNQAKQSTAQSQVFSSASQNSASSIFETGGINSPITQEPALADFSKALSQLPQQATPALFGDSSPFGDSFADSGFGDAPFSLDQFKNLKESQEKQKLDQLRMKRHMEIHSSPVYDAEAERNKEAIKHILDELSKLSTDLSDTYEEAKGAKSAVINETISVGKGSLNFLEKLLKTISLLRVRVKQSRAWLKQMNSKQSKKLGFWGHVKKGNTQWTDSHERRAEIG